MPPPQHPAGPNARDRIDRPAGDGSRQRRQGQERGSGWRRWIPDDTRRPKRSSLTRELAGHGARVVVIRRSGGGRRHEQVLTARLVPPIHGGCDCAPTRTTPKNDLRWYALAGPDFVHVDSRGTVLVGGPGNGPNKHQGRGRKRGAQASRRSSTRRKARLGPGNPHSSRSGEHHRHEQKPVHGPTTLTRPSWFQSEWMWAASTWSRRCAAALMRRRHLMARPGPTKSGHDDR